MDYPVKLQMFEGPLDLLLHLIDKAEVDIYDIPIAEITDQYLDYLYNMQEFKIDIASEFLVMAATLLAIKSRMLLPRKEEVENDFFEYWEEEEFDPRTELIQRLIEYRRYKVVAEVFKEKEFERSQVFTRPADDLTQLICEDDTTPKLTGLSIIQLVVAFESIWQKHKEENIISTITKEEISVTDKMEEISFLIQGVNKTIYFNQLFIHNRSRSEMVVTFLAILELIKQRKIVCYQSHNFSDIEIRKLDD